MESGKKNTDQELGLKVGMTGGAGVGKTTAARFLKELGFFVLDADALAQTLRAPGGRAHTAVVQAFGTADRAELSRLVFEGGTEALKRLEAIIHPLLADEVARATAAVSGPWIYEASLLVETGRYRDFDYLLVIEAPLERRKAVLQARGWSDARTTAILARQASDAERRTHADWVIENDGTEQELREKCRSWAEDLRGRG